jgi:hypothetical protein
MSAKVLQFAGRRADSPCVAVWTAKTLPAIQFAHSSGMAKRVIGFHRTEGGQGTHGISPTARTSVLLPPQERGIADFYISPRKRKNGTFDNGPERSSFLARSIIFLWAAFWLSVVGVSWYAGR